MNKSILLQIMLYVWIPFCFGQESLNDQIMKVENGLLPVNIFEGEPSFNLNDRMKFYKVPGLSITVIKDYKVHWTKYYGVADEETKSPVTGQTLFNVGSLSKGVTSLTVLSLIREGKLDLNEDVNQKLKSWKIPQNEWTKNAIISPMLLMNHSSGAMHHFGLNYTRENFPTITQYLKGESPAREKPTIIDKKPGTEFQYSNPGFAILQQLVEDITGQKFYKVAEKNVFRKLGMNKSTFEQPLSVELEKFASAGHRNSSTPLPVKRYYYPNTAAGGLWTTSPDYAKYVIELQKSYHGKSNKIISKELSREMLKTHVSPEYGLGVFIRKPGKEFYFSHMGDNAGFFAGFVSHLTDGNGVVIFTNSNTSPELIKEISNSVAKEYLWKDFLPATIKKVPLDDTSIKNISGRYKAGSDRVIEISLKNGELHLVNLENEKLVHVGNLSFMTARRAGKIQFYRENDGLVRKGEYRFADEIGRLPGNMTKLEKMADGEKTPCEYLFEGNFQKASEQYRGIYRDNPKDEAVNENRLDAMGYTFLNNKNTDAALVVFKLNIEFHPESANCYDSYGEALALAGQTEEAVISYEKALGLNPDLNNAREMIKKLTVK